MEKSKFGVTVNTPVFLTKCSNVPMLRKNGNQYSVTLTDGYMLFSYNYDFDIWVQGKSGNYQINIGGSLTGLKYSNLKELKANVEKDLEALIDGSKNRVIYIYLIGLIADRINEMNESVSSQKFSAMRRLLEKEAKRLADKYDNLY